MTADVGDLAPDFDLESDQGARMSLSSFAGKWLVLYFYPRDNTPGCTREAQAFTEAGARLRKAGAEVAGVSRDSVKSHSGFRDKFKIGFPLLSDPDLTAHTAYGAWGKKMMYGKAIEGTIRSTFLVSPEGRLARVWRGVKVDGHADAVLAALAGGADAPSAKGPGPKKAAAKKAAKAPAKEAPAKKAPAKKAKRS